MRAMYYTDHGQPVRLGAELGGGGEGRVYAVEGRPGECAKIYAKKRSEDDHRKVLLMVANPPTDPTWQSRRHRSIAWPSAVLYADRQLTACAGFLMPRLDLQHFKTLLTYVSPDDRVKIVGGGFTWRYLFTAARNLASAVAAVHECGYCIGDLNESNILVAPTALVTLIDCDSFQVRDQARGKVYRCMVGKAEYTAPELQGKRFPDHDRTPASDAFGLSVLLFQLVMEGTHPYAGRGPLVVQAASTHEEIVLGHFPYGAKKAGVQPPVYAPPFDILHPDLQNLFLRCFQAGHRNPGKRPSAGEWLAALAGLQNQFITCPLNQEHEYLAHLKSCPWCKIAAAAGTRTTNLSGTQKPLPSPKSATGAGTTPGGSRPASSVNSPSNSGTRRTTPAVAPRRTKTSVPVAQRALGGLIGLFLLGLLVYGAVSIFGGGGGAQPPQAPQANPLATVSKGDKAPESSPKQTEDPPPVVADIVGSWTTRDDPHYRRGGSPYCIYKLGVEGEVTCRSPSHPYWEWRGR